MWTSIRSVIENATGVKLIRQIVSEDDNQPMMVNDQDEFDQVSGVCWLATGEAESLAM